MGWNWMFPHLLTVTLAAVFQPVFSRRGNRPLPPGLEGDPWTALIQHRDRLLRQLKEWQLEGDRDPDGAAVQAGMERELAIVLDRLDRYGPPPGQEATPEPPKGKKERLKGKKETPQEMPTRHAADMGFATAIAVLLAVLAGGLYIGLTQGSAGGVGQTAHMPDQKEFRVAVDRLAQRMEKEPDNLPGWLKLARSQAMIGNKPEATRAYNHILERQADHLEATMGLAELQVQSSEEEEVKKGVKTLDAILAKHPDQPDALWLVGTVEARMGRPARAIALWKRVLPTLPEGSEDRATVEEAIREAGGQLP